MLASRGFQFNTHVLVGTHSFALSEAINLIFLLISFPVPCFMTACFPIWHHTVYEIWPLLCWVDIDSVLTESSFLPSPPLHISCHRCLCGKAPVTWKKSSGRVIEFGGLNAGLGNEPPLTSMLQPFCTLTGVKFYLPFIRPLLLLQQCRNV
jgi:hypothetical protein